jgi:predicted RNA-binding protein associated with RNAse of E/G family
METITVVKNDHAGRETLRYTGRVLAREALVWVRLEAHFSRPDVVKPYHTFRQGDRFIEWHYSDRWYNILEMHDRADDRLTGWYCNVTRPAIITPDSIRADDLALDVFAAPDGTIRVLDEDEFAALPLDESTRTHALHALDTLIHLITARESPFSFPESAQTTE